MFNHSKGSANGEQDNNTNVQDNNNAFEQVYAKIDEMRQDPACKTTGKDLITKLDELEKETQGAKGITQRVRRLISVIGAVKAGKSTLMNALLGKKYCQTGAATEVTKLCSVFVYTDKEEKITTWELPKPKPGDSQEGDIELILNDALSEESEVSTEIKVKYRYAEHPCTKENIEKINQETNYSLAIFYINSDILKTKGANKYQAIALADLPGLDGIEAGSDENKGERPIDIIAASSTDLMFIQSTVGAINQATQKKITSLQDMFRQVNLIKVLNGIEATPWNKPEKNDALMREAKDNMIKTLNGIGWQRGKTFVTNALEAYEAQKHKGGNPNWREGINWENLYENSEIEKLKKELEGLAKEGGEVIIRAKAESSLEKLKKKFADNGEFGEIKKNVHKEQQEAIKKLNALTTKQDEIKDDLKEIDENLQSQYITKYESKMNELLDGQQTKINESIKDNEAKTTYNMHIDQINEAYSVDFDSMKKCLEKDLIDEFAEKLKKIVEKHNKDNDGEQVPPYRICKNPFSGVVISNCTKDKDPFPKSSAWWFHKSKEEREKAIAVATGMKTNLKKFLNNNGNELKKNISNSSLDIRNDFLKHMEKNYYFKKREEQEKKIEDANKIIEHIDVLKEKIEKLEIEK